jgi:hypothetical protein
VLGPSTRRRDLRHSRFCADDQPELLVTFFSDLSHYSYSVLDEDDPSIGSGPVLAVGWLAAHQPFATGPVDEQLVAALIALAADERHRANQMRGFHLCEFCESPPDREDIVYPVPSGNGVTWLGSDEIHVVGVDGRRYAAPSLIVHYVLAHRYQPPAEFRRAAISTVVASANGGPLPRSVETAMGLRPASAP